MALAWSVLSLYIRRASRRSMCCAVASCVAPSSSTCRSVSAAKPPALKKRNSAHRMSPVVLGAILVVLGVARAVIWVAPTTVPSEKQRNIIKEYLDAFIIAGVVALVLMHFVIRTFWIPSGSMEPHLAIPAALF